MPKLVRGRYYDLNTRFRDSSENFYRSASALVLWARMNSPSPVDDGPLKLSPTYDGSPAVAPARIGDELYSAATFNDSANINAQVTDTSGRLCFTSLADGGTPGAGTDRPFSISCWVKLTSLGAGSTYFFGKQGVGGGTKNEYRGYISSTGNVYFRLEDETASSASETISMASSDDYPTVGVWSHLVFTYDGRGGASANAGMKLYKDGAAVSLTLSDWGTYVGMQPEYDNPLYIGAQQGGAKELNAHMAEFAVWSSELSSTAAAAIYNVTRDSVGGEISGYLNNPARILLQDQDNATGSYPTVARTGDPDFTGTGNVFFDDTKTIEFFSSYATAQIEFAGRPRDADTLSLTGSTEASKRLFEFQRGVLRKYKSGVSGETVDSALVDITGRIRSTHSVAHAFAQTVNSAAIGIEATTLGPIVKLRQHTPVTGTYVQGNLISSSSRRSTTPIPIVATQFKQHGPENYRYPMMLPSGYVHMSSSVATPNTLTTLQGPAIMGSNTSGVGITFTPGEKLTAFNETRIPMDNDDEFYTIGTSPTVLPGFNQRLSSKTSFAVDINPSVATSIGFSTGTVPGTGSYAESYQGQAAGINSGIAYFNFVDKQWEIIGDLTTGSNVDYLNSQFSVATGSMLAINPTVWDYKAGGTDFTDDTRRAVGLPDPFAGFPLASKFDATGSQLLDMSQYLTAPFLLEKVVIEVSGAFGTTPSTKYAQIISSIGYVVPHTNTVMLLNQYGTPLTGSFESKIHYVTGSTRTGDTPAASPQERLTAHPWTRDKDIITFGRLATYATGTDYTGLPQNTWCYVDQEGEEYFASSAGQAYAVSKPVQIPLYNVFGASSGTPATPGQVHTGSVTFELEPKVVGITKNSNITAYTRASSDESGDGQKFAQSGAGIPEATKFRKWSFGNSVGSRNLHDLSTGRAYVKSVAGSKFIDSTPFGSIGTARIFNYRVENRSSPYILLPTDKLILAWVNQHSPYDVGSTVISTKQGRRSEDFSNRVLKTKLEPGLGKITFYGSLLRDNKAVDFTLNQPLTSDAIHEDVRDDISPYGEARCLDQFDVEPETSFRGGYLDNIVTGSMYGSGYVDPFAANTRAVQTSIVDGQAGITGSLQRFVRMTNSSEVFYDSTVPNLKEIRDIYGSSALQTFLGSPIVGGDAISDSIFLTIEKDLFGQAGHWSSSYRTDCAKFVLASAFERIDHLKRQTTTRDIMVDQATGKPLFTTVIYYTSGVIGSIDKLGDDPSGNDSDLGSRAIAAISRGAASSDSTFAIGGGALVLKAVFGIGDFYGFPFDPSDPGTATRISYGNGDYQDSIYTPSLLLRGFKYGLLNAVPTSPNAVFRYDTFGQFRDMLEPRSQSRFFEDGKLGEPAVTIAFYDRDGTPGVKPSSTNAQNLSLFATSSVPYFDMPTSTFGRDRSTVQPDLDPSEDLEITTS